MRKQGANVDDGQKPGCKHGMRSGGTARRKAQYERAQRKAFNSVLSLRAKRRLGASIAVAAREAFARLAKLKAPAAQKAYVANDIVRKAREAERRVA